MLGRFRIAQQRLLAARKTLNHGSKAIPMLRQSAKPRQVHIPKAGSYHHARVAHKRDFTIAPAAALFNTQDYMPNVRNVSFRVWRPLRNSNEVCGFLI